MSYNGLEINEFPLLFYTIFHTILLLAIIAIGIVGFFVFYDKEGKKAKKRMKALDEKLHKKAAEIRLFPVRYNSLNFSILASIFNVSFVVFFDQLCCFAVSSYGRIYKERIFFFVRICYLINRHTSAIPKKPATPFCD